MSSLAHKRVLGLAGDAKVPMASPAVSVASSSGATSKKRAFGSLSSTQKADGIAKGDGGDGGSGGGGGSGGSIDERIAKRARLNSSGKDEGPELKEGSGEQPVERSIDLDADLAYLQRWEAQQLAQRHMENKAKHVRRVVKKTMFNVVESLATGLPYQFKKQRSPKQRTLKRKAEGAVGLWHKSMVVLWLLQRTKRSPHR